MKIKTLAAAAALVLATAWAALAGVPQAGEPAPDGLIPSPPEKEARQYLGVGDMHDFKFTDVDAKVVVMEIINAFCPYCQKAAPHVNELWDKIQADPALKGKIKFFAVAVNNSQFEVDVYRDKYGAKYPIVPDIFFKLAKMTGEQISTPTTIAVRIDGKDSGEVIYSHSGKLPPVDEFIAMLKEKGGLK